MCSHIRVLENVKESTRTNELYDDIPNFVVNSITMVHQTVNENDDVFQQENKNDNDYIDTAFLANIGHNGQPLAWFSV